MNASQSNTAALTIGVAALAGVAMSQRWHTAGILLSSASALAIANLAPIFKWDSIVSGFEDEAKGWTRIFKGYENILSCYEISDKNEILSREFQRIKELQTASALNNSKLPQNARMKAACEDEVREYWELDT